jgi:YHS domain-containing protein
MNVNPREAAGTMDYQGRTYYFCSEECKEEFERNPQRYIGQKVKQR